MDKDQKLLINGKGNKIQIWDFNNENGTINQKQTLNLHTKYVLCLCFSKKRDWFISGSQDNSMIIWNKSYSEKWYCYQQINDAHQEFVTGIVINNEDDQIISCSLDKTIKVWMISKKGNFWETTQLLLHEGSVRFLSLSPGCNLLASSGHDKLSIWQVNVDLVWKDKDQIIYAKHTQFNRISFIDNNNLLVFTRRVAKILRYSLNNKGKFEVTYELRIGDICESLVDSYCFPMIYNHNLGLVFLRHSNNYIYFFKIKDNGELIQHQILVGNFRAGYMTRQGNYLILGNQDNGSLQIWK